MNLVFPFFHPESHKELKDSFTTQVDRNLLQAMEQGLNFSLSGPELSELSEKQLTNLFVSMDKEKELTIKSFSISVPSIKPGGEMPRLVEKLLFIGNMQNI